MKSIKNLYIVSSISQLFSFKIIENRKKQKFKKIEINSI